MDGARMMNACVKTGVSPKRMCQGFDSISVCLSKGLGTPMGSVLVGSSAFIKRAHRVRKMLGGGLRQSGIIAAAGLYALENNVDRLKEDHRRARALAEAVDALDGFSVNLEAVQTNMVFVTCSSLAITAQEVVEFFKGRGVDIMSVSNSVVRLVTHIHVTDKDIETAIEAFKALSNASSR